MAKTKLMSAYTGRVWIDSVGTRDGRERIIYNIQDKAMQVAFESCCVVLKREAEAAGRAGEFEAEVGIRSAWTDVMLESTPASIRAAAEIEAGNARLTNDELNQRRWAEENEAGDVD